MLGIAGYSVASTERCLIVHNTAKSLARETGMAYRIAGVDVHKKMLAVAVADVVESRGPCRVHKSDHAARTYS
jgi:hypothetical protein